MFRWTGWVRFIVVGAVVAALGVAGCTKRPSQEELTKLDEARMAAESAEKKLGELKEERAQLEKTLADKQAELKKHEQERDELKQKMGKQ